MNSEFFIQESKKMSQDEFVSKYQHPFLLSFSAAKDDATESLKYNTVAAQIKLEDLLNMANQANKKVNEAFPISKNGKNPFASRIIVGRASNSDICIDSTKISKVHSYFQSKEQGYFLVDSSSTNGTFVNNKKLEPSSPEAVKNKDQVSFCDLAFTFYTPEDAYNFLRLS